MTILDTITAKGHTLIQCTHTTTIELTKDTYLTKNGTCILGIETSKACYDLNPLLKKKLADGEKITVIIKAGDAVDSFYGFGHNNLTLLSKKDIVFRKSNFICDRTILIKCSKSSSELDRNIIKNLTNSKERFSIIFKVNDVNG
ncbi:MAG TPA: DUF371 domain-containing protein [Candidatus Nanopelagicaceae bacterium]|jgi:hypothetical protein|nr:DUF371 domain-containing protein [Candidatus Nanopelagicaceae bacterium]